MILGIGIDAVDIVAMRERLNDGASSFKKWHFTAREREYCEGLPGHDPAHHYAGRFAAKEAFIKALGPLYKNKSPDITDFNYLEMEVTTEPASGPEIKIGGKLKQAVSAFGEMNFWLSISHEANMAVAMIVLEKK